MYIKQQSSHIPLDFKINQHIFTLLFTLPCFQTLAVYNVLSTPVSDFNTNEYVGIIDVVDILNGILQAVYPELLREGYVQAHKRLSMTELQAIGFEFTSQTVAGLVHGGDLWYKVSKIYGCICTLGGQKAVYIIAYLKRQFYGRLL